MRQEICVVWEWNLEPTAERQTRETQFAKQLVRSSYLSAFPFPERERYRKRPLHFTGFFLWPFFWQISFFQNHLECHVSSLRCQSAEVQRSCNEKSSTFESVTSKCDPDTCHQPLIDSQDKTSLPSHYSKSGSPTHWSCQSGNLTTLPLPIIMWACERYIRYNPGL